MCHTDFMYNALQWRRNSSRQMWPPSGGGRGKDWQET